LNTQALDLLTFSLDEPHLFDLSHLTYLEVQGDKALDFLQGQLTCDVRRVSATTMVQGALCNLKGRVLALLDVFSWQGSYGLLLPRDMVPILQKDLQLIAKLSRISMVQGLTEPRPSGSGAFPIAKALDSLASKKDPLPDGRGSVASDETNARTMLEVRCFGLYLPQGTSAPPLPFDLPQHPHAFISTDDMACYALDHQLFIILCATANPLLSSFPEVLETKAWHQLLLIHDHPTLHPETSGQFLPHQLQLEQTHVSFEKGCYKGQEIIARMHYLGKNKYCLRSVIIQSETVIHPGMSLQTASNQSMGEIVDVVALNDQSYLILANILESFEQPFLNNAFVIKSLA
jgi:folate-binding protein YgfZ